MKAALRYDEEAAAIGKPLNFPLQSGQRLAIKGKAARLCTSIHKGVYWKKDVKKWVAFTTVQGKTIYIDACNTEVEAARAHDKYVSTNGDVVNKLDADGEGGNCRSELSSSKNLLEIASSLLSLHLPTEETNR